MSRPIPVILEAAQAAQVRFVQAIESAACDHNDAVRSAAGANIPLDDRDTLRTAAHRAYDAAHDTAQAARDTALAACMLEILERHNAGTLSA
jgi:hypothetical protein